MPLGIPVCIFAARQPTSDRAGRRVPGPAGFWPSETTAPRQHPSGRPAAEHGRASGRKEPCEFPPTELSRLLPHASAGNARLLKQQPRKNHLAFWPTRAEVCGACRGGSGTGAARRAEQSEMGRNTASDDGSGQKTSQVQPLRDRGGAPKGLRSHLQLPSWLLLVDGPLWATR